MSTNKRRHAAETFLSRMGAPKQETTNVNEQKTAEAEEHSFVSANEQKSVETEGQQTDFTNGQENKGAIMQESKLANEQKDKETEEQESKQEKMRRITFNIPESLYKQLKWLSVQEDITMLEIGAAMAQEFIDKRK